MSGILKIITVRRGVLLRCVLLYACFLYNNTSLARVQFSSRSSSIVLTPGGASRLQLHNPSMVTGWSEESIVRNSGYKAANLWTEQYGVDSVITGTTETLVFSNSNAISSGLSGGSSDLTVNNSNAIVRINAQAQTMFGPESLVIDQSSYVLTNDLYVSADHTMSIQGSPGASREIDGSGHTIYLSHGAANVIQILDDLNVTFKNVAFKNYTDTALLVGTGVTLLFGDGVRLEFAENNEMTLDWRFDGNVALCGNGTRLSIAPASLIRVLPDSNVTFQNMFVDGLKANNITCANSSTLTFNQCHLCLSHNFSFTSGSIVIGQDVQMTGTNKFSFESDQVLSVSSCSRLTLDGVTFRYAPSIANRDLFVLLDKTSELFIDGAALETTTTGMRLTRGTLIFDHRNTFSVDVARSISTSEGFAFGDGVYAHDLTIQAKPAARLELQSGGIDYQNSDTVPF